MYPSGVHRRVYSPDSESGADSSFPERHFTPPFDEKPVFSGIAPDQAQPVVNERQTYNESDLASASSQCWASGNQPTPHPNHDMTLPYHGQLDDGHAFSAPLLRTTAPLLDGWSLFNGQSSSDHFWQPTQENTNIEDDSDSIQSPDGSDDAYTSRPSWFPAQTARRQRSHRVSKPAKAALSTSSCHRTALSEKPYIPDFVYNQDWPDQSDLGLTPLPHRDYGTVTTNGNGIEITFQDSASSSKEVSKRIAHKLSEKTRRNRLTIAIREIQKLLPSQPATELTSDADFLVRPGVPSSKLDVVEMAVGFIKDLKEKNEDMKRRLREVEQKLAQCQCRRDREGSPLASGSSSLAGHPRDERESDPATIEACE
ncbi:uncharacterized protein B0T15DRAFT_510718 [Chaetomium strumarium]|uniref:BHLH domain-containing protein n=1 Tax=Chaetomium strumarium TaxID=1170767 RepID=A0AAJ0M3J8_9PEZI|nr:hypothetical protein B0T15DRAFT_510718 [Chaetomium strumarium]